MMIMLRLCLIALFFLTSAFCCKAQQTITTAGGNGTSSTGSISFSVGQVVYNTSSSNDFSIGEGVQQPFEISNVTGITKTPSPYTFSLYPNPAQNFINLLIDSNASKGLTYRITDFSGKIMKQGSLSGSITQIPVEVFAKGTYMIYILQSGDLVHTFSLVKH